MAASTFSKIVIVCIVVVVLHHLPQCQAAKSGAPKRTPKYLLNKPQCTDESLHKIEMIIAKVVAFGPNGRKLPEKYEDVKKFCAETNQMVAQIEAFLKDCFHKTVRDYVNILLYTIKRNIRKYCGKRGSKVVRDLIKLAPCVNKHIQPKQVCSPKYIDKAKQLIGLKDDTHKLHYACCYFLDGVRCVEDFLDTVPCIRDARHTLTDMVRSNSGNLFETMCGKYNDQTDACEKLGPAPKPTKEITKHYMTPMTLMIDLLESMKNFSTPIPGGE